MTRTSVIADVTIIRTFCGHECKIIRFPKREKGTAAKGSKEKVEIRRV